MPCTFTPLCFNGLGGSYMVREGLRVHWGSIYNLNCSSSSLFPDLQWPWAKRASVLKGKPLEQDEHQERHDSRRRKKPPEVCFFFCNGCMTSLSPKPKRRAPGSCERLGSFSGGFGRDMCVPHRVIIKTCYQSQLPLFGGVLLASLQLSKRKQ